MRWRHWLVAVLVGAAALAGCQRQVEAAPEPAPATSPPRSSAPPSSSAPADRSPSPLPSAAAPTASGANTILSPADGATVPGPRVTVSGTGTAFEATLLWRVLDTTTGQVVAEDFTMGGSMGEIGPFSFEIELAPGVYQAEVWAPDMSDGEAGGPERIDLVAVTFLVE